LPFAINVKLFVWEHVTLGTPAGYYSAAAYLDKGCDKGCDKGNMLLAAC